MRIRIAILLALTLLSGCDDDSYCTTGAMRCNGRTVQMCGIYGWDDFQSCAAIGQQCSTSPTHCGGYSDTACCY